MIQIGKVCVLCFAEILYDAFLQIILRWLLQTEKFELFPWMQQQKNDRGSECNSKKRKERGSEIAKPYPIGFIWWPYFDIVIQSGCGQNRKCWMTLETIDDAIFVARQPLNDFLRRFVPHEEIAAITSAHHKFGIRTKEIHAFYCWRIPKMTAKMWMRDRNRNRPEAVRKVSYYLCPTYVCKNAPGVVSLLSKR